MKAENQAAKVGVSFADRQSAPRFAFAAPVQLTQPLSRTRLYGKTTEISRYGCFAEVDDLPSVNCLVELRIKNGGEEFNTWAEVIHIRSGIGVGLHFMETAPDQVKMLERWLSVLAGWLANAVRPR